MKVNVAGAGAGKTSMMADRIKEIIIPEGKVVFCIAFTNAAVENIENKAAAKLGRIPDSVKICTIHSFLYRELINPYYYFLFGKQFERLTNIDLPVDYGYRRVKLSDLEGNNILHYTKIPEKAKWVAYKKSGDKKETKALRERILQRFAEYCKAILVDEAQDIGQDVKHILEALDASGVEIILYGDPKQDVKGLGCFRAIVDKAGNEVNYIPVCHRCPQKHLDLSNTLAQDSEKQIADDNNAQGSIEVVYESDIESIQSFIDSGNYGLQYISMKRDRFATHEKQHEGERFTTLLYEVCRAIQEKWKVNKPDIEIYRAAFFVTEQMIKAFDNGSSAASIISTWVKKGAFDSLSKQRYAQMVASFQKVECIDIKVPVLRSIEIIKGLEAERCLFVLTTDLAPYLFLDRKDDNKTKHLLYVALTRSLEHLTIMVTREVEEMYTRARIDSFFQEFL